MKPSLVVGLAFVMFVGIAPGGPGGPGGLDGADASRAGECESAAEGRLHLLLTETETGVQVSPADPDAELKKGQYRVACESFTFEWRGDQPVLVFLDVVMESEEGRIAGTKAIHYLNTPGSRRVEVSAWIQPVKGRWEQVLERQKESIERGMKASELEHRQRWENRLRGTRTLERKNLPRVWQHFEGREKRDER